MECSALLQWQIGMEVQYHPGWPKTHLQPLEHSVLFLLVYVMPLQLLEATLALVLDGDGG
jgi:hypothetical protein